MFYHNYSLFSNVISIVTLLFQVVKDLKDRLKNHRPYTPPLEGIGFEYGFNTKTLDSWVQYWQNSYNFAEREKFFNQFPHYKTKIQGLDIHFIRVTPTVSESMEIIIIIIIISLLMFPLLGHRPSLIHHAGLVQIGGC
jgi:hypothetical protein